MKVSDLLEQLQKYPPDTEIITKRYFLNGELPSYYYAPMKHKLLSEDYVTQGTLTLEKSNKERGRLVLVHYE